MRFRLYLGHPIGSKADNTDLCLVLKSLPMSMPFSLQLIRMVLLLFVLAISCKSPEVKIKEKEGTSSEWTKKTLLFEDSMTKDWTQKWFLDGKKARIDNLSTGMYYAAGPENKNDTSHAVLWTKSIFSDDIMIEFEYTRADTSNCCVNIIYFHATGKGGPEYPKDITQWNEKRTVPTMSTYFRNMNTYHLSFATSGDDYIRLRRYDPTKGIRLKGTDIPPDTFGTGLFKPFETYHIQITRFENKITMNVQNKNNSVEKITRQWDTSVAKPCNEGHIGLRHMYTRAAIYKDFKVWRISK